jgi:hypothetical protein
MNETQLLELQVELVAERRFAKLEALFQVGKNIPAGLASPLFIYSQEPLKNFINSSHPPSKLGQTTG